MNYYLDVLKKYVDFTGRARRTEFWMFLLINFGIVSILYTIEHSLGLAKGKENGIFSSIYELFIFLPTLAVVVRRLHDLNKSGWWVLINFVPIIGSILLLIYEAREGDAGTNQYGPDPKLTTVRI